MPKILIVDDSLVTTKFASRVISSLLPDCEILSSASGEQALAVVTQDPAAPDLALIDYNMPGMNGIECGEQLRRRFPTIKIGLVTANVQDAIQQRARDAGMILTSKPLTDQKLTATLRELGFEL